MYILIIKDVYNNLLHWQQFQLKIKLQRRSGGLTLVRVHWTTKYGMPHEIIVHNHPGFQSKFLNDFVKAVNRKVTLRGPPTENSSFLFSLTVKTHISVSFFCFHFIYCNFVFFPLCSSLRKTHICLKNSTQCGIHGLLSCYFSKSKVITSKRQRSVLRIRSGAISKL